MRLAKGNPFVAGPHINIYNGQTLEILAEQGAARWVMPVELSRHRLAELLAHKPQGMETEVFAWGRLPLAFSSRCFSARRHNLPKDDCRFKCLEHPHGMALNTREGQPFLAINGIQTQSCSIQNLIGEIEEMRRLGVDVLRISPQAEHTEQVIKTFRSVIDGAMSTVEAKTALAPCLFDAPCDGYWHGRSGIEQSVESLA